MFEIQPKYADYHLLNSFLSRTVQCLMAETHCSPSLGIQQEIRASCRFPQADLAIPFFPGPFQDPSIRSSGSEWLWIRIQIHTLSHTAECALAKAESVDGHSEVLSFLYYSVTEDPGSSLQLCTKQTVHCKPLAHGLKSCPKTPDSLSVLFIKLLFRRGLRVKTHITYFQCRIFFESVFMVVYCSISRYIKYV